MHVICSLLNNTSDSAKPFHPNKVLQLIPDSECSSHSVCVCVCESNIVGEKVIKNECRTFCYLKIYVIWQHKNAKAFTTNFESLPLTVALATARNDNKLFCFSHLFGFPLRLLFLYLSFLLPLINVRNARLCVSLRDRSSTRFVCSACIIIFCALRSLFKYTSFINFFSAKFLVLLFCFSLAAFILSLQKCRFFFSVCAFISIFRNCIVSTNIAFKSRTIFK